MQPNIVSPPDRDERSAHVRYSIFFHDGEVVHVHKHVSFAESMRSDDYLEAHGRRLLASLKPDLTTELHVLHADTLPRLAPGERLGIHESGKTVVAVRRPNTQK